MIHFDPKQILWTEKYRPSKIDDCILPDRIKKIFHGFVKDQDFPSLLLAGSAGTGKTTVAKALCNELEIDYLFINASNERGIDTLRTTIVQFASSMSLNHDNKFKCIIMDEFDQATPLLQAALRASIEEFAKTTRFIFTCNYPNKIIEPIHSRCAVINFALKNTEKQEIAVQFLHRIESILQNENIAYDKKAIVALIKKYFPDFRRVINELQRLSKVGKIDEELVAINEDVDVAKLVQYLKEKDFTKMRQWVALNVVNNDVNALFRKVYDQLVHFLQPEYVPEAIIKIADYQYKNEFCADKEINFVAFCIEMMGMEYK